MVLESIMLQGSREIGMNDANLLSARGADRVGNFDATIRKATG